MRSSGSMQRPETKARARALQLLYAWDLSGAPTIESVVARVAALYGRAPRGGGGGYDRAADLAAKAVAGLPEFDRRIADAAEHWRLERVGVIERNILRLALAELDEASTPSRVVIDEAVKLAHWFAGARAPAFINGILDAVARESGAL
jgi:N utilization substance protein B